jgi:hypothetical protein
VLLRPHLLTGGLLGLDMIGFFSDGLLSQRHDVAARQPAD